MTGFCGGIGAVWLPVIHLTGLLRRLAMTMYVAVIAKFHYHYQTEQNDRVL